LSDLSLNICTIALQVVLLSCLLMVVHVFRYATIISLASQPTLLACLCKPKDKMAAMEAFMKNFERTGGHNAPHCSDPTKSRTVQPLRVMSGGIAC
jgi:hypothetical protein